MLSAWPSNTRAACSFFSSSSPFLCLSAEMVLLWVSSDASSSCKVCGEGEEEEEGEEGEEVDTPNVSSIHG